MQVESIEILSLPKYVLSTSKNFAQALQTLKLSPKDTPLASLKHKTNNNVVCWPQKGNLKQTWSKVMIRPPGGASVNLWER